MDYTKLVNFIVTAEDDTDEVATSLIQTTDGGYAMAGYTFGKGAGDSEFLLVKVDSKGNKQWDKTYGGSNGEWSPSLIQTTDGGYAMAGEFLSSLCNRDFLLVKVDSYGNKQWNKTFGKEQRIIIEPSPTGW